MPTNRKISDFGNQSILLDTDLFPLVDPTEGVADNKNKSTTWLTIKNSIPTGATTITNVLLVDNTATPSTGVRGDLTKPFDDLQDAIDASQSNDVIWVANTGSDYVGEYTVSLSASENLTIEGIGYPIISSPIGDTLSISTSTGILTLDGLVVYNTSIGGCPLSNPLGGSRAIVKNSNIYAHGSSCITIESSHFFNCFFESAGNAHLFIGAGNLFFNGCYLYQPSSTFWNVACSGSGDYQFNDCWIDGGLNGFFGNNSDIVLEGSQFKDHSDECIVTRRSIKANNCIFQNTDTTSVIQWGYTSSKQSQISNSTFINAVAANTFTHWSTVGIPSNALIIRNNIYDCIAESDDPLLTESINNFQVLPNIDTTGFTFTNALDRFEKRI